MVKTSVGYGDACLPSQHSRGRGRTVPKFETSLVFINKVQTSQDFIEREALPLKTKSNQRGENEEM